jgi:hypothetical protein
MTGTNTHSSWPLPATQLPNAHLTWAEWCAVQARQTGHQQQSGDVPFSDRERALLAFLRSLYQTERIPA